MFRKRAPLNSGLSRYVACSSVSASCFSARRNIQFTWQNGDLGGTAAKRGYSSPIWIPMEDIRWVSSSICPLKADEKPLRMRGLPVRLLIYNMSQIDTKGEPIEQELPPESEDAQAANLHAAWNTKTPYSSPINFQLEQRAVIHNLKELNDDNSNNNNINSSSSGEAGKKKALHYFWITPAEVFKRGFRPKREQEPFAVIVPSQKYLYNGDQFAEPTNFETFPFDIAGARPFAVHQRAAFEAWHSSHMATLRDNAKAAAAGGADDSNDADNELSPNHWHNRLCLFGKREELEQMNCVVKQSELSQAIHVPKFKRRDNSETEERLAQQRKIPRGLDLFHYSDIVNHDKLWGKVGKPSTDQTGNNSSNNKKMKDSPQTHKLLPSGSVAFPSLAPALTKFMETHNEIHPYWVARDMVKSLGLQLREGAEAVSSFAPRNPSYHSDETVEYFHISQCENPKKVLLQVGLHTR